MFYRRLVMSFAWRRQMPKLAISLGLEDQITDMIEELISQGQQLDAINVVYEAGLQDKFPSVPLLKSVLKVSESFIFNFRGSKQLWPSHTIQKRGAMIAGFAMYGRGKDALDSSYKCKRFRLCPTRGPGFS